MTDTPLAPQHPSTLYLIRQWMRQAYDEVGAVIFVSTSFFLVVVISLSPAVFVLAGLPNSAVDPLWVSALHCGLLGIGLWFVTAAWLALHRHTEQILTFQYPDWWEFWRAFPGYLLKALWAFLVVFGGMAVLVFNLSMYPSLFREHPVPLLLSMAVTLWLLLFLGLIQVHLFPLLVHQERPFRVALKRAVMVAAWKPVRTFLILLLEGLFLLLCVVLPFLFFLVPGAVTILSNLSLLILLDEWRDPYEKTPEAIRAGA